MPEIYGTRSRKMEVNYDYYRIFYYAAKYKSFSQAATILMSNQPNVTRAIHNLESQLGCRLFIRSNRGAELTPEGERLYSHVAIAYDHLHAAELELENEKKLEQGTVTIGVSEIALHLLLLPVLGEFRRKYPKIRLRISSYTAPQAIQTVRNGLSDFAVASTPAEVKKPLKAIPLLSFKEILVANAAYKDMFKEPVSLKKLVEYPFICLGKNTSTYDFYTRFFLEHGIAMTADTEAATIDQILPMVRQNLGIGFIPEPLAQEVIEQGIVIQVPLLEEPPVREICFVEDKSSPHSMAANVLKEMLFQAGEKE